MLQNNSYDERTRKATIMKEVLPDEAMWEVWEKTEAPLRKGRGWYPALDKRFLELLVETEIDLHSLSLATSRDNPPPLPFERYQRNREKVRRVAQSRIGQERLQAYCDRVKEAFDAYVRGGLWNLWDDDGVDAVSGSGDMDDAAIGVEAEEAAEAEVAFRHGQTARGENRWASPDDESEVKARGRDRRSKGRAAKSETALDQVENKLSSLSTAKDDAARPVDSMDVDGKDASSVTAVEAITQQGPSIDREGALPAEKVELRETSGGSEDAGMTVEISKSS